MPENVINLDDEKNADSTQNAPDSRANQKNILEKLKDFFARFTSKAKTFKDSAQSGAKGAVGKVSNIASKIAPIIAKIKEIFQNKIILYATIGAVGVVALCVILIVLVANKPKPLPQIRATQPKAQKIERSDSTKFKKMDKSDLQSLIAKASMLYNSGHVASALDIYDSIAVFSQSFANFNLGVAKLKERDFNQASKAFDNVIASGENVAAAALNNATIAYQNNNFAQYDYYTNLAQSALTEWSNKPLYSYIYSLVNYYGANYFNALSSLNNATSPFYAEQSALLAAKIYLNFNDEYSALKKLLGAANVDNRFTIGLLYARMGEYDLAVEQISSYLRDFPTPQAKMALALVEMKRSNFTQTAEIYKSLLSAYDSSQLVAYYPIKIKLQDALFDINLLQRNFWQQSAAQNHTMHYKIIFYFAPFRVFSIDDTISLIKEGGMRLKMNNIEEASESLLSSVMRSRINQSISQGLREILSYNISEALHIMKNASLNYPNHQILQYNLGLIYAQINDFENARRHFLKAYHLDSHDIMSGIFALMCAELTYNDTSRILNELSASLEDYKFESPAQDGFYRSLLGFANGNLTDDMFWLQDKINRNATTPLMYALNALYSLSSRDREAIRIAWEKLCEETNNDMVALILSRISGHWDEDIKRFSLNLFSFFKNDLKNLDLVYTGPSLARQIYIYMAFMVGANSYVDEILNNKLLSTEGDVSGILQALALNAIYLHDFERAFAYYNELIDTYKITQSETYFYAGVAAIGAGYYDNAVALIQLARMDNGANLEARYALGLLHQAMGNLDLASMQFGAILRSGFRSGFFDFEIDTSEILSESSTDSRESPKNNAQKATK